MLKILIALACFSVLAFQNCGKGFQSQQMMELSSIMDLVGAKSLAGSSENVCAITADSKIACWGTTKNLPLMNSTDGDPTDLRIFDIGGAKQIQAGNSHFCAMNNTNSVYCWGSNKNLQIDPYLNPNMVLPAPVPITFGTTLSMEINANQTCVRSTNDNLECRGSHPAGSSPFWIVNSIAPDVQHVYSSGSDGNTYCIIPSNGRLLCAGTNQYGIFGTNPSTSIGEFPIPVFSSITENIIDVKMIPTSMCFVNASKDIYCRGYNLMGVTGRNFYYNFPRLVDFQ